VNGLAEQDEDGHSQQYVMKHLQQKLFQNRTHRRSARDLTSALADLVLEAMYLSRLEHPHIVTLRAMTLGGTAVLKRTGATEQDYFLILDRMEGTLDQRIRAWKSRCRPEPELMAKSQYAFQIADALRYLHERRIIYRGTVRRGWLPARSDINLLYFYIFVCWLFKIGC
jgi:serine/threonine protein kinase